MCLGMQNDFIHPGPLCVNGGTAIIPAVKKAVSVARDKGALVVWVSLKCGLCLSGLQARYAICAFVAS